MNQVIRQIAPTALAEYEIEFSYETVIVNGVECKEVIVSVGNPNKRLTHGAMFDRYPLGGVQEVTEYHRTIHVKKSNNTNNPSVLVFKNTDLYLKKDITDDATVYVVRVKNRKEEEKKRRTIVHVSSGGGL